MGRKKPTNKELVDAIINLHNKVDYLCSGTQHVVTNLVEFLGKTSEFKDFLKVKYNEDAKKEQDTKKSK